MKIIIDNKPYKLNVSAAINAGALVETHDIKRNTILAGDVFRGGGLNPFLVVRVTYSGDDYQLLGIGCKANSGPFFDKVHSLEEIKEYLEKNRMTYVANINSEVINLVNR
jgi:hypothetical protein